MEVADGAGGFEILGPKPKKFVKRILRRTFLCIYD